MTFLLRKGESKNLELLAQLPNLASCKFSLLDSCHLYFSIECRFTNFELINLKIGWVKFNLPACYIVSRLLANNINKTFNRCENVYKQI